MRKTESGIKEAQRNLGLDLLKLLSCFGVILLHTMHDASNIFCFAIYQGAGFAVPCFFMTSGYVLLNRGKVGIHYAGKKIGKILRIVALWNLLVRIAVLLRNVISGNTDIDLRTQLANYFKNSIRGLMQRGALWQFWYLGALTLIYLLLPVISKFFYSEIPIKRYQRLSICWIILVAVSVTIQLLSYARGISFQNQVIQTFRVWTWLQYFILGGLIPPLEGIMKKVLLRKHGLFLLALTAAAVAIRMAAGCDRLGTTFAEYFYDDPLTIIWMAVLFTFVLRVEIGDHLCNVVGSLIPLTMGVYIMHPIIQKIIEAFLDINGAVMMGLEFLVLCLTSFAGTFIIKKLPFGKYLVEI